MPTPLHISDLEERQTDIMLGDLRRKEEPFQEGTTLLHFPWHSGERTG